MESHKRTMLKTITWRLIATLTTVLTIYFWTSDWSIALGSGLLANAMKTILYYIHERAWNLTDFGRSSVPVKTLRRSGNHSR